MDAPQSTLSPKKPKRMPTYPREKAEHEEYTEGAACPIETQDVAANLANRQKAIEVANYGPLDPSEPNTEYWQAAADRWEVTIEEVQTARCGNCAAFNVTTPMQACIAEGVGGGEAEAVIDAGAIGFCEVFDFKCAAARRCDGWMVGGPITDELAKSFEPEPTDPNDADGYEEWADEEPQVDFRKNNGNMVAHAIKIAAPQWMRDNARQGIEWVKEGKGGEGLTAQTMQEARTMAAGTVSDDKAMRMAAWFARHMVDLEAPAATVGAKGYPSNGVVAHALWGGGSVTDSERAAGWARERSAGDGEAKAKYGAAARRDMMPSDFVLSDERKFPIMDAEDIAAAVSSWGRYKGRVTFAQFKERLTRLAKRKGLDSALPQAWRVDLMKTVNENFIGGEVKALGNGKLGGYLVRFTTEAQPDLQGDYFTKDTELGTFTDLPVLYHHGADKTIGKRVIGRGTIKQDAIGLWVEAQLAMRDEYEKEIYALAEKGALGWSSGAVSHLVEREYKSEKIAWVKTWWIAEASLTPTPAEAQNEAITIKGNVIAMPEEAQPVSAMQIQTISDDTETLEETKKTMEANDVTELKAQIAALTAIVNEPKVEAGKMAPVVKSLGGDHDGGNAFKHWIRTGQMNYYTKNNEQDWSATKTNALNEATGTEGGILVPEGLNATIIAKRDEMSVIRANGALVITTNLDTVQVPVENAKMTTAIVAESGSYVAAEPTFTSNSVTVYKFGNQLRLTDELLADNQTNLMPYLSNGLGRAFGLMENQYCIAGTGSSQPKGLLTGGTAAITAASTTAITAAELVSLYHALPEPYTTNPNEVVFITRNATLGALRALASSSVFTFNLQPQGDQGAQQLYGHKVAVSGYMEAATTGKKSLLVTNLAAGYILIERAGMVMSRNPYLLQATGQVALFTTMRFGGTTTVAEATQILTQA